MLLALELINTLINIKLKSLFYNIEIDFVAMAMNLADFDRWNRDNCQGLVVGAAVLLKASHGMHGNNAMSHLFCCLPMFLK